MICMTNVYFRGYSIDFHVVFLVFSIMTPLYIILLTTWTKTILTCLQTLYPWGSLDSFVVIITCIRLCFLNPSEHYHLLFKQDLNELFLYGVLIRFKIFIITLFEFSRTFWIIYFISDIRAALLFKFFSNINLYQEKM